MKIHKSQSSTFIYILILFFICILSFLIINTPGIRGDIEQSLRIFFKQPVLLKSERIKKNKTFDYVYKIYNSIQNKYTNFNSDIKKIDIHIPFEGVQILKEDRKESLKIGKLIIKRKINGYIIFENKKYDAEFRLKGDYFDHWRNIKQWSLRVQLKKNKAIEGMNEFSLTIHSARGFPYNYLIYDVLKKYNVLTPSYKDFRVKFNGENWGVMLAEEQMSKTFYAFNQIKEAPIFKMTNEEDLNLYRKHGNLSNIVNIIKWQGKLESKIYNEKKIKKQTNIPFEKTNYDLISLFASIQEILLSGDEKSKKQILNYLNIEKFAEARAITLIFGDVHSVHKINSRYYINPYTLKIEPILTDFHASYLENQFEKEDIFSRPIYHLLKNNIIYQERFNEVLI